MEKIKLDRNFFFLKMLDYVSQKKYSLFLLICLIFLLEVQFFNIGPTFLNEFNHSFQKILIVMTVFLGIAIFYKRILFEDKFVFGNYVNVFIFYCLVEGLLSLYKYDLNIVQTVGVANYVMIILAYYLFSIYINNGNKNQFINIIMFFSLIYSIILLIQYVFHFRFGVFLNFTGGLTSRDGILRITQGESIINIGILLALGQIVANKFNFKLLPYATFSLGVVELIYVQGTRMVLLCLFLIIVIQLFIMTPPRLKKIFSICIAVSIIIFIVIVGIVNKFIFFESMVNSYSFTARVDAISFFSKQIYENFIFGMGFIPFEISPYLDYLLRGPEGVYFKSDIGIIGFTNIFGFIGMLWLIVLFYKIVKIVYSALRKKINESYEVLPLVLYILFTFLTLSVFDIQRIIVVPILLALIDYLNKISKNTSLKTSK